CEDEAFESDDCDRPRLKLGPDPSTCIE
ncbi:hypothetical protein L195_g063769, partial [Trifolium pratense]